jgi:hypothetical protein
MVNDVDEKAYDAHRAPRRARGALREARNHLRRRALKLRGRFGSLGHDAGQEATSADGARDATAPLVGPPGSGERRITR